MKKTKEEKEAEVISNLALELTGLKGKLPKGIDLDPAATIAGVYFSNILREKRTNIEIDLKYFCKKYKFQQYKVKDIENGSLRNIDHKLFKKYIEIINAEFEIIDWIKKYPNIAKKYKITV